MASSSFTSAAPLSQARRPQAYPTTPPPLSASDIAEFGQRRRSVSRGYQTALANREAGRQEIDGLHQQFVRRLGRERAVTTRDLLQDLGGRGLARSARFAGQGLARVRDEFADRQSEGEFERATRTAALDRMVNQARTARDEELTAIEADAARRRTSLDKLLRQVGA